MTILSAVTGQTHKNDLNTSCIVAIEKYNIQQLGTSLLWFHIQTEWLGGTNNGPFLKIQIIDETLVTRFTTNLSVRRKRETTGQSIASHCHWCFRTVSPVLLSLATLVIITALLAFLNNPVNKGAYDVIFNGLKQLIPTSGVLQLIDPQIAQQLFTYLM